MGSCWQVLPGGRQQGSSSSSSSHVRQRARQRRLRPCSALPRIASLETEPATADRVPQYKMPKGVRFLVAAALWRRCRAHALSVLEQTAVAVMPASCLQGLAWHC